MTRLLSFRKILTSALVLGAACTPPVAPPAQGFTRIIVEMVPAPKVGMFVRETSNAGRSGSMLLPMVCAGDGGTCTLDYCNAPLPATNTDPGCPAPGSDGRYHLNFVVTPAPNTEFLGWNLVPDQNADPTLQTSDLSNPTLDVSWAQSAGNIGQFTYRLKATFGDIVPPDGGDPSLSACTGPVTDLLNLGDPHASELLVACNAVVLAKKDGTGSYALVNGPARAIATDGVYAYFDAPVGGDAGAGAVQVVRVPLVGGSVQPVGPAMAPPITWIGGDDTYVYFTATSNATTAIFSANKDGTPYPDTRSNLMYGETNVVAADTDGVNEYVAYSDGPGTVTIASFPKGADASATPTKLQVGYPAKQGRLRHGGPILAWGPEFGAPTLAWGTDFIPKTPNGAVMAYASPEPLDAVIADSGVAFLQPPYVFKGPKAGLFLALESDDNAPPLGLAADTTRIYWTRNGALRSAPW